MERAGLEDAHVESRKILVAAALSDREGNARAMELLRVKSKPGVEVLSALRDVDWNAVRQAEGGWTQAYEWAARQYDSICAVPVDGADGLSRGVFSMVQAALALGKPVLAIRAGELIKVERAYVVDPQEYKGVHGRLT